MCIYWGAMEEPDTLPNPCTPFEKARERLTQIATEHITRDCVYRQDIQQLVRRTIEFVFQDAEGWFTYERVLCAKLYLRMRTRMMDGDVYGESIIAALSLYEYVTGQPLLELPFVNHFLSRHSACTRITRRALGEVATAWQIISNGGIASKEEMLATVSYASHPELS